MQVRPGGLEVQFETEADDARAQQLARAVEGGQLEVAGDLQPRRSVEQVERIDRGGQGRATKGKRARQAAVEEHERGETEGVERRRDEDDLGPRGGIAGVADLEVGDGKA